MKYLPITLSLALSAASFAGTQTWFTPLTQSAPVTLPNSREELTQPWTAPAGLIQKRVVSLRQVEDQVLSYGQNVVRVPGQATSASMFDMVTYDPSGNFLFIPHETPIGAGVSRYNLYTNENQVLFAGDGKGAQGDWTKDWGAFDPARFTPNGTVITGEEWAGQGRVMEILNPFADPSQIQIRELNSIANVGHEGIDFSKKYNNTIYYVDEYNSGSIYKFVMTTPGDYTKGQTFVLSVNGFSAAGGDSAANYNAGANLNIRTGEATWVPLTDAAGVPLAGIRNPFKNGSAVAHTDPTVMGGRVAADDAKATPFGRPEDCEIGKLANGNEVFYFTATSENIVYSVEMVEAVQPSTWVRDGRIWKRVPGKTLPTKAIVREFINGNESPKNLGFAPTTGIMNSPDNLAQDALGNIYVIEDAPNDSATGGDVWFLRDTNNDGVAESFDHFLSIRVDGSEATGMVFNPVNPEEFVICVQHPDSTNLTNVPNGMGDAVWMFNISNAPNQQFISDLRAAAPIK